MMNPTDELARRPRAVSMGGGTGQPNAIRALLGIGCQVTAIVDMVDDGGSTGILRTELGLNPPGDIRKCLVAMAEDPMGPIASAFEHRFGFIDDHPLGNLMIASLASETGSFVDAIEACNRMLKCRGDVLPSTLDDVVLCGTTRDGQEFRGQVNLGIGPCALDRVWLDPTPRAYDPAVQAILEADIVVLGPGSLFTSIIPNILVPGIADALRRTHALTVYVGSMADMQGETWGLTAREHVDSLFDHGLAGALDVVLVHRAAPMGTGLATKSFQALTQEQVRSDAQRRAMALSPNVDLDPDPDWYFRPVEVSDEDLAYLEGRVPVVISRDFSDPVHPTWHNVGRLAAVLKGLLSIGNRQEGA